MRRPFTSASLWIKIIMVPYSIISCIDVCHLLSGEQPMLSVLLLLLPCIIVSDQIVNSVCWSHALVNGPTSKMPASDGGMCIGQLLMMWSAVCSGSPHSHAALSASPHFFMDALYRPTPVRSRFRFVHCFRLRSSPLTPSPGSDT